MQTLTPTAFIAAITTTAHQQKMSLVKQNDKGDFDVVHNFVNRFTTFVAKAGLEIGDDVMFTHQSDVLTITLTNEAALAKIKICVEQHNLSLLIAPKFTKMNTGHEIATMTKSQFILGIKSGIARAINKDMKYLTIKKLSTERWVSLLSALSSVSYEASKIIKAEREKLAHKIA